MNCKNCGNDADKDAKFCVKCGTSMSENREENVCYFGKMVDKGLLNDIKKYLE
jgi:uncharacterized membrane protein YvbJ